MDWKITYKDRICTAKEAVSHIKSGDRVAVAHACSEPVILTDAMVEIADEMNWKDIEVVHMVAMGKAGYCAPEMAKHFRITHCLPVVPQEKRLKKAERILHQSSSQKHRNISGHRHRQM